MISLRRLLIYLFLYLCVDSKHKKVLVKSHQHGKKIVNYLENKDVKRESHHRETTGTCYGRRQSPIKINSSKTKKLSWSKNIHFSENYYSYPKKMHLIVKSNSLHIALNYGKKSIPSVQGNILNGTYKINHIVLHWGEFIEGSEHTIDDETYNMEVQLVHINKEYKNFEESLKHENGIFIYSTLFKLNNKKGTAGLELIAFHVPSFSIHPKYKRFKIAPFPISWLMSSFDSYFLYKGSITYPPCAEVVTWIISSQSQPVNTDQLRRFRMLYKKYPSLKLNIRNRQPWNGRTIYRKNVN
nr:carbonic anhydrase 1-like isoform X1 [Onthophagus taurus]